MRRLPILIPHRPGCADFPLPVLHGRASLAEVQMTPSVTCRQRTTRGRTSALPDFTGTIEVLRLPATHSRSLICFASGSARSSSLRVSQLALPVDRRGLPGRGRCSPGDPVGSHAAVSGITQVSRQSIPCLCPALATPAEPTIPRLLDGFVDAVPALPTAKTSAVNEFRGSVTRLWHPLPTLQESCCHHPCKARFRLAGLAFTGRASNPLDRCKRFQIIHPPFLDLAWRKGSFILNLPSHHSITSSARASSVGGTTPVRLPPGRLRLVTRPSWTGSTAMKNTIGIVVVAVRAASTAGVLAETMTVT